MNIIPCKPKKHYFDNQMNTFAFLEAFWIIFFISILDLLDYTHSCQTIWIKREKETRCCWGIKTYIKKELMDGLPLLFSPMKPSDGEEEGAMWQDRGETWRQRLGLGEAGDKTFLLCLYSWYLRNTLKWKSIQGIPGHLQCIERRRRWTIGVLQREWIAGERMLRDWSNMSLARMCIGETRDKLS